MNNNATKNSLTREKTLLSSFFFCFNSKIFAFFILFCIIRKFHEIIKKRIPYVLSQNFVKKSDI